MTNDNPKSIAASRRDFLRRLGLGGAALGGYVLSACTPGGESKERISPEGTATGPIPEGKMTYRTNPTSGDKVSLLGYGCMRWPTKKDADGEEVIDQEEVNRLVDVAIKHGVNYFDTSPAYCRGHSEEATGIALARYPRNSYYIATKLSNFSPASQTREASIQMYRDSMRYLQTDYIDYMLLHSVGGGEPGKAMDTFNARYIDNGILDFLMKEREAGRIRNLGFSYHGDIAIFDYLLSQHDKYKWDFVQIQLNYLDWDQAKTINPRNTNAEYLYTELEKRGIPAVIMEPLLGGRLSKVPDHVVARLKQREPERSVASWAFRFAGTFPGVLCVLSGMTRMEHLEDNLRTYCPLKPLSEEEFEFLNGTASLLASYPTVPCNECNYCMPCSYGIDIPGILSHYNKCVNEGSIPEDAGSPDYRKARRAYLISYDRSVEKLRQANHCIGCGKCIPECPQRINIPKTLARIDAFVEKLRREEA